MLAFGKGGGQGGDGQGQGEGGSGHRPVRHVVVRDGGSTPTLHLRCDALKAQGVNLFDKSQRLGGIRKLTITLPDKKRGAKSAQPTDAKSRENVESSTAALDVGSAASVFDLG